MKLFKRISLAMCLLLIMCASSLLFTGCDRVVWMHYNNNGGNWTQSFMETNPDYFTTNTTKWNRGINETFFDIAYQKSPVVNSSHTDIEKEGFTFGGWYYDEECTDSKLFCPANGTFDTDEAYNTAKNYWTEWFASEDNTSIQIYAKWVA